MLAEVLEQTGVNKLIGWHDEHDQENILQKAWTTATYPFRLASSPTAIKAYLTTFLFLFTSSILLSISSLAFAAFYYTYIPQTDLERPIYLQYAAGAHPRAELPLNTNVLISQQPYDVSIVLHMPRTPANLGVGNFMVDLTLYGGKKDTIDSTILKTLRIDNEIQAPSATLHHSRRPAMLPYSSTVTNLASTLLHLPLHLVKFKDADSITLTVPMFEELEFARGKDKIPTYVAIELQSQTDLSTPISAIIGVSAPTPPQLQVYSAKLVFQVRFHGLRYLIYNYRLVAFIIFTGLFYTTSISTLAIAWAVIAMFILPASSGDKDKSAIGKLEDKDSIKIKQEQHDLSDPLRSTSDFKTERDEDEKYKAKIGNDSDRDVPITFPALGRNAKPLEYTPQTSEGPSSSSTIEPSQNPPLPGQGLEENDHDANEHADDEDEEESEDEWQQLQRMRETIAREARQRQSQMQMQHDSGIGTSMESEGAGSRTISGSGSGLTRRRSQRSIDEKTGKD